MKLKIVKALTCFVALPATTLLPISLSSCGGPQDPQKPAQITVTLNANGGTISESTKKINKGTIYSSNLFVEPIKPNYVFSHWTFNDDSNIPTGYVFENDITLKAQYVPEAETVLVTLNPNGGTISQTTKRIIKGTTYSQTLFPTPTKSGYLFSEWTFNDDTKIPQNYKIDTAVTFKAKWNETEDSKYLKSLNLQKPISNNPYLWEATYADYDDLLGEEAIYNYYSDPSHTFDGACSSFINGKLVGRNFDYFYSTTPEIIVHTPSNAAKNRYATVGITWAYELTGSQVNNINYVSKHKNVPALTVDGINEKGFFACMNEVPAVDVGRNPGDGSSKQKMNELRVVRYLLDHAESVSDVMPILDKFNIYLSGYNNEGHIMVADATGECGVIEFEWTDSSKQYKKPKLYLMSESSNAFKGIMTNFTFTGYDGDCINWATASSSLQSHAEGCERYNIVDSLIDGKTLTDLDAVLEVLKQIYYTKSYSISLSEQTSDFWFSEFNYSSNDKTTQHTTQNYNSIWSSWKEAYDKYLRNGSFYMTRNSCAYDLVNKKFKIIFEEKEKVDKEIFINRE